MPPDAQSRSAATERSEGMNNPADVIREYLHHGYRDPLTLGARRALAALDELEAEIERLRAHPLLRLGHEEHGSEHDVIAF